MNFAFINIAELLRQIFGLDQFTSEVITAIILFVGALGVTWVGHTIFERYFKRWAAKTETTLDDEILRNVKAPVFIIALLVGAYYSVDTFSALEPYSATISEIFTILEIFTIAFAITRVLNVLMEWYGQRRKRQDAAVSNHILFILNKVLQIVTYAAAFIVILIIYQIDLTGAVVGLGVGGIAIAFALQNTLSDFFSAFSIYFDRPFEIGDFVVVGEYSGTVTKIGMKSTRLQLLQGEELVISNKELTSTSVRNFKKLQKRRTVLLLGVTYDTPLEKLQRIPSIIGQIIKKFELVEFERAHFTDFGDFSLKFEVVYYMKTADYLKYMDTKQAINFEIMAAFEEEGIEMAFPTQTVYVKREKAKETVEMAVPTQTIFVKKEEKYSIDK